MRIRGDDEKHLLSKIFDIEIGSWDCIYVGDEQEARILVFDSVGHFIRYIGRRGYGPGEFQRPANMGWLADTLWVTDDALLRVSYFDTAGSLHETARISGPAAPPGLPKAATYFSADGSVVAELLVGSEQIARTREITELPLLRMRRNGQVVDTIARLPVGQPLLHLPWGNSDLYTSHPFPLVPLWKGSPNGHFLVFVELPVVRDRSHGTVRVVWRRADGSISHAVRYPFQPLPLTTSVKDSVVEHLARQLSNSGVPQQPPFTALRKLIGEQIRFPAFRPPVTYLVVGRDSTVWLRREDTGGALAKWDVLDWSGTLTANLEAPASLTIYQAQRGTVWGTVANEDGVPQVIKYRVLVR